MSKKLKLSQLKKAAMGLFFILFIVSCAGSPPLVEQSIAVEAERYAKNNNALKYAPKTYRRGSEYLRLAHDFFEKRVYPKAKTAYIYARKYFERAEVKSRVDQVKSGGGF